MIPLYASKTIQWLDLCKCDTAHPGLHFDKFPGGWKEFDNYSLDDNEKKQFYEQFVSRKREYLNSGLQQALSHQIKLVEHLDGILIEMTTDWRFVSGLGLAHPYETGLIWHKTLGIPYLPGSSVKGMMRAWAEQWGTAEQEEILLLFGPAAEDEQQNTGSLIIFDALPAAPPKLELDIINPHYPSYYKDQSNPPADYDSPIPVFFLAVAPNQRFNFYLAPRPGGGATTDHVNQAKELLTEALSMLGSGGKTAVGYGVMNETDESIKIQKQKKALQSQIKKNEEKDKYIRNIINNKGYIGIAAELFKHAEENDWNNKQNLSKLYQDVNPDWLDKIKKERDKKIQEQARDILIEIMEKHFLGITTEPEKTRGKKVKYFYKNEQARMIGKALLALKNVT